MSNSRFWSIKEFAEYAHTTRQTLIHYDQIGLLSPATRGDGNKYRYYHSGQLTQVNLIRTLQKLGVTLEEIKSIKKTRTPNNLEGLLEKQVKNIDAKIAEWVCSKKLLYTIKKTIHSALNIDEKEIVILHLPAEAIVLGDLNDYSIGRDDYDALSSFYSVMREKYPEMNLNYPVWGRFSESRIKRGDWKWPDRYYFYNPDGYDQKPAALYAIGYTRGWYGQGGELYRRLLKYIDEQGYEVCGDAYEEYPLNEISITDENNYLIRVMITVQKKANKG